MIINEKLRKEFLELEKTLNIITENNSITDIQIENFLKCFEKARYNVLNEIKLYNKNVVYNYDKIKTIDTDYKANFEDDILKIYIPEVLPSYKNLKTHTHKRILLNVIECTKQYSNLFKDEVFIYIKIFNKIQNWDIDNKYIKPISDALVLNKVIEDDNISKMFYCCKGEISENPHTEIFVFDSKKIDTFLENCCTKKYGISNNF